MNFQFQMILFTSVWEYFPQDKNNNLSEINFHSVELSLLKRVINVFRVRFMAQICSQKGPPVSLIRKYCERNVESYFIYLTRLIQPFWVSSWVRQCRVWSTSLSADIIKVAFQLSAWLWIYFIDCWRFEVSDVWKPEDERRSHFHHRHKCQRQSDTCCQVCWSLFFHISWDFSFRSSLHSPARVARSSIKIYLHKDMLAPSLFRTELRWIYFSKSFAFSIRSYSNSHKSLQQSFLVFVRRAGSPKNSR